MTKEEIAGKVEWEGGIPETILMYGLSSTVLPHEAPIAVREAWERLYDQSRRDIILIEGWLYS